MTVTCAHDLSPHSPSVSVCDLLHIPAVVAPVALRLHPPLTLDIGILLSIQNGTLYRILCDFLFGILPSLSPLTQYTLFPSRLTVLKDLPPKGGGFYLLFGK